MAPSGGVIQGNLIPKPGNTITRLAGVQIAEVVPPVPFRLVMTSSATVPGADDFEWESQDGQVYDLVSSTDPSTGVRDWAVWAGRSGIVGPAPSNTLTGVPRDSATECFFAVASLVTKAFTVPAAGATLAFSQYIDTEVAPSGDLGSIRLLNADGSVLAGGDVVTAIEGVSGVWSSESIALPAVAHGLSVKIEFRFESDGDSETYAGFYIDDVLVTAN